MKYSLGCGDRFGLQGAAQMQAYIDAKSRGIDVVPVWNKSYREHSIIHTAPTDVRVEADAAVKEMGWDGEYYVDADHINLGTVDDFIEPSDFFTLDVAESIGKSAPQEDVDEFVKSMSDYIGQISLSGIDEPLVVTEAATREIAARYLFAVSEAGQIYSHVSEKKDSGEIQVEVSMDETEAPQTPVEMLFILAMIAREGIPVDTVAPKFSGRFNKGVDYVGDVAQFEAEFDADAAVIEFAIKEFGLADGLRLSVHSGSDKFSIYPAMNRVMKKRDTGLHLKTAGTTWLEEIIGLAEADGEGLVLAKELYAQALDHMDELCKPYAAVIDIDSANLPAADDVGGWTSDQLVNALRHVPDCPGFNSDMRQLMHVGYKIAANMGDKYLDAVREHRESVSRNVTQNLLDRHIIPVFG